MILDRLSVVNSATGRGVATKPRFCDGPVDGLDNWIILVTPANLNMTVSGDNCFIGTRRGEDTFFFGMRRALPNVLMTLAGYGQADVEAGRLVVSFGTSEAAGPYLHLAAAP